MKWIVDSTPQKQANYIGFLAKSIQKGFFQSDSYLILPYQAPRVKKSVFFPDLGYSPAFWHDIALCSHLDLDQKFPVSSINLPPNPSSTFDLSIIKTFWSLCLAHFGIKYLGKIKTIEILPTPYGTIGSFVPRKNCFYLTWRTDMPTIHICRTLLLCIYTYLTKIHAEIGDRGHWQRQASIEFIMAHPPFKDFFKDLKFSPPTKKHLLDSQNYLAKLGFNSPKTYPIIPDLSAQEQALWQALSHTQLVTFDAAATAIWGEQSFDKYSPYTMAKIIQTLRRKLARVSPNLSILTLRKQGYLLN